MKNSDGRQEVFDDFVVPDQGRISKVYDWLKSNGRLDARPLNVLEIGYAKGGLLDRLAGVEGVRLFACDTNKRRPPPGTEFVRMDLNGGVPDFGGTRFDVVFAGEVLEHVFDDENFLRDIGAVLKPGGCWR